jgi:hypothetical protein
VSAVDKAIAAIVAKRVLFMGSVLRVERFIYYETTKSAVIFAGPFG